MKGRILHWAPRLLAIGYILFLGIFALDVFAEESPWYMMIVGFLMHLIPNFLLALLLWYAWKHESMGGVLFILMSLVFVLAFENPLSVSLILSGPLFLTGILFLLEDRIKSQKTGGGTLWGLPGKTE